MHLECLETHFSGPMDARTSENAVPSSEGPFHESRLGPSQLPLRARLACRVQLLDQMEPSGDKTNVAIKCESLPGSEVKRV